MKAEQNLKNLSTKQNRWFYHYTYILVLWNYLFLRNAEIFDERMLLPKLGSARSVMVIVVGNGHCDTNSRRRKTLNSNLLNSA